MRFGTEATAKPSANITSWFKYLDEIEESRQFRSIPSNLRGKVKKVIEELEKKDKDFKEKLIMEREVKREALG